MTNATTAMTITSRNIFYRDIAGWTVLLSLLVIAFRHCRLDRQSQTHIKHKHKSDSNC